MSNITVFGTGSWGTALANVLADNQHDVLMSVSYTHLTLPTICSV